MQVVAIKMGFFGGSRRRIGDVFEVPEGAKASWFTPDKEFKKPKEDSKPGKKTAKSAKQKDAETLSELNEIQKEDDAKLNAETDLA